MAEALPSEGAKGRRLVAGMSGESSGDGRGDGTRCTGGRGFGGGFWHCPDQSCCNVNSMMRNECHKCGEPFRPKVAETEETGETRLRMDALIVMSMMFLYFVAGVFLAFVQTFIGRV